MKNLITWPTITVLTALYLWERFARQSVETELEKKEGACGVLAAELLRVQDELDATKDNVVQLEECLKEAEAGRDEAVAEARREVGSHNAGELDDLRRALADAEGEIDDLVEQIRAADGRADEAERELQTIGERGAETAHDRFDAKLTALEQHADLTQHLIDAEKRAQKAEEERDLLLVKIEDLEEVRKHWCNRHEEVAKELDESKSQIRGMVDPVEAWERFDFAVGKLEKKLARSEQAWAAERAALVEQIGKMVEPLDAAERVELTNEILRQTQRAERAEGFLREATRLMDIGDAQLKTERGRADEAERRTDELEEKLAAMTAERDRFRENYATDVFRAATELLKQPEEIQHKFKELETDLAAERKEADAARRQVAALRRLHSAAQEHVAELTRQLSSAREPGRAVVTEARLEAALERLDWISTTWGDMAVGEAAKRALSADATLAASAPPTRKAPLPGWMREKLAAECYDAYWGVAAPSIVGTFANASTSNDERTRCRITAERLWLLGYNAGCAPIAPMADPSDEAIVDGLVAKATAKLETRPMRSENGHAPRLGDTAEEEHADDEWVEQERKRALARRYRALASAIIAAPIPDDEPSPPAETAVQPPDLYDLGCAGAEAT